MKRIYEPAAYGPLTGCYWSDSSDWQDWPTAQGDMRCEVAIIGAGFTGLNAALHLASAGVDVAVFEAQPLGWGASGRNGGFCCLGGGMLKPDTMRRQFGDTDTELWQNMEQAAVAYVDGLVTEHGWDVDRHSDGETQLAHSARAWRNMQREAGPDAILHEKSDLPELGLNGPWHGGMTTRTGFALNSRKYLEGLASAARDAGARIYHQSPVQSLRRETGWQLDINAGSVRAERVLIATNGYSSEDLPDWLRARYLPVQSSVIVTSPLNEAEQARAGWTSAQMAYDSRSLLHYFRLMPNGRFLFGMRGGLRATKRSEAQIARQIRQDFSALFPAWANVEITHEWAGLVCLTGRLTPFVGPVPEAPGLFAALGYHGNGVAMGSYAGALIASQMADLTAPGPAPGFLASPPKRFPLGRHRRNLLRPAYFLASTFDL
jgi:glycine/D-amino acid oxidase-like deaminating enzyme